MNPLLHAIVEEDYMPPPPVKIRLPGIGQWVEAGQGRPLRVVSHDLEGGFITCETLTGERTELPFRWARGYFALSYWCGQIARIKDDVGQRGSLRCSDEGGDCGFSFANLPGSGEAYNGPEVEVQML